MDFAGIYFSNQYLLDNPGSIQLTEVMAGDSFSFDLYNATPGIITDPIICGVEAGTFEITWPGQSALSSQLQLNANPLSVAAYARVTITFTFLNPSRESVQQVDIQWAGVSVPVSFKRNLFIPDKPDRYVEDILEFKTDVAEAWDGTERRTRVRSNPRERVSYSYLVGSQSRAVSRSFQAKMMGLPGRNARVTMWHRSQEVTLSGVAGSGGFLGFRFLQVATGLDPDIANLEVGDRVWYNVNGTDNVGSGEVVGTTRLAVYLRPGYDYATEVNAGDVTLLPAPVCFMAENPKVSIYPSGAAAYQVEWLVPNARTPLGNEDETQASGGQYYEGVCPDTYLGRPILREGQFISDSLEFSSDSGSVWFDQNIGTIDTMNRRESSAVSFDRVFEYSYESGKVTDLRNFIHWTFGRQRSFWASSGSDDLYPASASADGSQVTFYGTDLGVLTPLLDGYSHLEASFGGTTKRAQITSWDVDLSGNLVVQFSPNFITANDLSNYPDMLVSFIYHVRLASDKVKLKYAGNEAVSCTMTVVSVKQ